MLSKNKPKFFNIFILTATFALSYFISPINSFGQQNIQNLVEPSISIVPEPEFNTIEDFLYIEGRSNPNAIITVMLEKQGNPEKPVKFVRNADSLGEWVVTDRVYLTSGDWKVVARQQIGASVSGWSNPRIIRSKVNGINIFGLRIKYVFIASILLFFLLILLAVFIYFKKKINILQKGLRDKQLKDTEERFHKGFAEIRKDLMDQLKALAQESQTRPLKPEEIEKRDKILEEIDSIERNLDHDIGDLK
ncbi:MAG: hypothetical protein EXS49_01585 [Candidatus Pacebacteria bacterium]|nr:hypothetical protein [Candidatus Paceibacterota bacterium]